LSTSSAVSAAHDVISTVLNGVVGAATIEDHLVAAAPGTPRATSSSQTTTSDFTSIFAATPITPSYHAAFRSRGSTAKFTVPAPLNITIGGEEYNESSPVHRALLMSASRVTCASEFDALWLNQDGAVLSACDDDHRILQPISPSSDALQALQFAEPVLDADVAREAELPFGDESSRWNDTLQSSKLWVETAAPGDWVRLNPSTLATLVLKRPPFNQHRSA
jgi:hypothetical protein